MHGGTDMLHLLAFFALAISSLGSAASDEAEHPKSLCYEDHAEDRPTTYVLDCVDLTRKISHFPRPTDMRAFATNRHDGRLLPVTVYQRTCSLILSWNDVGLEQRSWPPPDWASWDDIGTVARNVISDCPWHRGKQRAVGFGGAGSAGTHQMVRVEIVGRDTDRGVVTGMAGVIDLEEWNVREAVEAVEGSANITTF